MITISTKHNYKKLFGAIALCEFSGLIAGLLTAPAISNWYIYLHKPGFTPPGWIFAPVWTILYLLMGLGFYNILINAGNRPEPYKHSLALFWVQLTLNMLWVFLFFGLKNPLLAVAAILGLTGSVCFWIIHLQKVHRPSAYLQIPYLLWCSFAMVLNYYIIHLN